MTKPTKLTKRFIDLLQASEKDRIVWDSELSGFGIRIKPSGVKSYLVQYRHSGRSRRLSLGKHGVLTADEARKQARIKLGSVASGEDPAEDRLVDRNAPTMKDLKGDYLERHAIPNKRPNSVRDDKAMLAKIVLPAFATKKVKSIARRDIETLLISMKDTPYRANRVQALLSKMFSLAMAWNWRDDNPVLGIPKYPEEKRDEWLEENDLSRLFTVLEKHPNQKCANIVRLLVLTGARSNEVFKVTWAQIDLERGVWTKPAHFTKQKRREHTPLSAHAMELLADIKVKQDPKSEDYIFPGQVEGQPITSIKKFWSEVCTAADLKGIRVHDLRHTFASHLASSGVSLSIVGKLLGHTQAQTTMRYAHLADDPLREAANRLKIAN